MNILQPLLYRGYRIDGVYGHDASLLGGVFSQDGTFGSYEVTTPVLQDLQRENYPLET